jgi:hypothetical protein
LGIIAANTTELDRVATATLRRITNDKRASRHVPSAWSASGTLSDGQVEAVSSGLLFRTAVSGKNAISIDDACAFEDSVNTVRGQICKRVDVTGRPADFHAIYRSG